MQCAFLARDIVREQAWRSLGGAQDGVLSCVTVFRAVPLNQPWAVDILFGDLSCPAAVVLDFLPGLGSSKSQEQARGHVFRR
jgi:hypothetical protein